LASTNARTLRQNRTDAERALWQKLRRKQLDGLRFRQQVPLGPYIVDFLCARHRLIIEVDGGQHAGANVDRARTAWLEGRGFRILRFWNNDVLQNLDGVIEEIFLALRSEGSPPPHPAPIEGAGVKKRGRRKFEPPFI
jgi:very-short-patch-repair endonuclease